MARGLFRHRDIPQQPRPFIFDSGGGGGGTLFQLTLTGDITPSGSVRKSSTKVLTGTATPNGSLIKKIIDLLTGSFSGSLGNSIPNWTLASGNWTPPTTYSITNTLTFTPTPGKMLVAVVAWDKSVGSWNVLPAGFTEQASIIGTSLSLWVGTKPADGTETSFTVEGANDAASGANFWIGEVPASQVIAVANSGAYSDTAVASRSTGTAAGTGFAVALMTVDTYASINDSAGSWSNGFTGHPGGEVNGFFRNPAGNAGQAPVMVAYASVVGTAETTYTQPITEAPDQFWGCVIIFGAGGGITGSLATQAVKTALLTGSITPIASLIKSGAKVLTGSNTPAGSIVKRISRLLTGGGTPSGALSRASAKLLVGSAAPTGSLVKKDNKTLTGSITPTGSLIKLINKVVAGAITPTGSLIRSTRKTLAGVITPVGSLVSSIRKYLTGTITSAGSLINSFTGGSGSFSETLTGAITPVGTLVKAILIRKTGASTPTGAMVKKDNVTKSGAITPAATVTKLDKKGLAGTLVPTGVLTKISTRAFTGTATLAGVMVRAPHKLLSGSISSAGAFSQFLSKFFSGSISPEGAFSQIAYLTSALWNWVSSGDVRGRTSRTRDGTQPTLGLTRRQDTTDTQPGFGKTKPRRGG